MPHISYAAYLAYLVSYAYLCGLDLKIRGRLRLHLPDVHGRLLIFVCHSNPMYNKPPHSKTVYYCWVIVTVNI